MRCVAYNQGSQLLRRLVGFSCLRLKRTVAKTSFEALRVHLCPASM